MLTADLLPIKNVANESRDHQTALLFRCFYVMERHLETTMRHMHAYSAVACRDNGPRLPIGQLGWAPGRWHSDLAGG